MPSKKKEPVKKRDRAASERALIKAATVLFAAKGFDGTRTLEIAKKAKVNEALIARYFSGKEGLLLAVLKENESKKSAATGKEMDVTEPSFCWIPEYNPDLDLKETLKAFFKAGLKHFEDQESLIRITLSQALIDPKVGHMLREKTLEQSFPVMLGVLKKHFCKKISANELESLVMLLMATNFAVNFMGRVVHGVDGKRVDRSIDLLIDALVARLE
jgi:AcrR family transcriptional regulator